VLCAGSRAVRRVPHEHVRALRRLSTQAHEKKRWGRLMKAKGDLCLMAGSCQDAFDHYR